MALPPFLTSIIGWLRAGCPAGVPDRGYIPLLALLPSQLANADTADELTRASAPLQLPRLTDGAS